MEWSKHFWEHLRHSDRNHTLAKLAKWLIDTFFHGKILYELYGFSTVLLGFLLESLTNYFIYKKGHPTKQEGNLSSSKIKMPQNTSISKRAVSVPDLYTAYNRSKEELCNRERELYPTKTLKNYLDTSPL